MRNMLFALAAATAIVSPAQAAITFNLGGSSTDSPTKTFSAGGQTLAAIGFTYEGQPSDFPIGTSVPSLAPIRQSASGIGVCQAGESGDFCAQVESHGPNASEGLAFALTDGTAFSITSVTFSIIDSNDTLQLWGGALPDTLDYLGFSGTIAGGLAGATTTRLGNGVYRVDMNTAAYQLFAFGQQRRGDGAQGDGFRINSISVAAVPEPATWAMMIAGFGMVGAGMRRRAGRTATVTA
ncbi:hypothetical protein GGR88_001796 [Sphingomonas jejuensis]|uniref:Ice-binding protein C-terminal domain-containing protein n=1 Tax=Sphingomonas jejuensis TaxID=904715 RepID=A0ABX0XNK4_9SPHN|nr:PEPxxWA-CTERM sorting domain-containing protein [Sphingomonas jejuensis]NJC34322.1 hypothetical protein [Sphingomonas jejuensis]